MTFLLTLFFFYLFFISQPGDICESYALVPFYLHFRATLSVSWMAMC